MSAFARGQNDKFNNWICSTKALFCLGIGISKFVQREAEEQYKDNVEHVTAITKIRPYDCNQCSQQNIQPDHVINKGLCKFGNPQNCHCKPKVGRRKCPQANACGIFHDLIFDQHTKKVPNWSNTNIDKWSTSWFEYIKCFISTPGYSTKDSVDQLDTLALLNICQNNERLAKTLKKTNSQNLIETVSYTPLTLFLSCIHFQVFLVWNNLI